MTTFTILWIIWAAIFINLFRWLGRDHPGTWVPPIIAALFLLGFSCNVPIDEKTKFVEFVPAQVEYGVILKINYVAYRVNPADSITLEWLGDGKLSDEEKNKKFYVKRSFAYFGDEVGNGVTIRK